MINAGCQLIIFLYLLDNETSYVILFSSGMGTAIELWKVIGVCWPPGLQVLGGSQAEVLTCLAVGAMLARPCHVISTPTSSNSNRPETD